MRTVPGRAAAAAVMVVKQTHSIQRLRLMQRFQRQVLRVLQQP
jgi:hypothetical protein